ncbi:hypothetical protein [Micromonospora sp. Llam0]|uniref:hypothetical protein n=1 Tax=Micromonospora sp. Llam0 TaxID=2485143 RepID=UPI0011CE6A39|nr:hypothetical protein [Micromonospora sp. Llam0]
MVPPQSICLITADREIMSNSKSSRTLLSKVAVVTTLIAVLSPTLLATPAYAGYQTPISGSTFSSGTVWYLSTTWRTVSFYGPYIEINIHRAPRLADGKADYMRWRINQGSSSTDGPVYAINETPSGYTDLGYYGPPYTQFRNKFGRGTTCNNCDHDFEGKMTY